MWVEKLGKDVPLSVLQRHKVGFIDCMYSFFGLFSTFLGTATGGVTAVVVFIYKHCWFIFFLYLN
jgi:hypothetical protein